MDAGISCRETEKRMMRLGLSISKVKAIFVSHEHSDHIRGIPVLARKYKLPIFITNDTYLKGALNIQAELIHAFRAYEPVRIGALSITAFPKHHDAADPHSFVVECNKVKVGVFTDIGATCDHLIAHFRQCNAAFLEANYDEVLLEQGRYPYYLKRRIRGGKGHLSNTQALDLFTSHKPSYMTHLLLAHLSQDNNCPELVYKLFSQHACDTEIIVASRFQETPVFKVTGNVTEEFPTSFLNSDSLVA